MAVRCASSRASTRPEIVKRILTHLAVREPGRIYSPRAPPLRATAAELPISDRVLSAPAGATASLRLTAHRIQVRLRDCREGGSCHAGTADVWGAARQSFVIEFRAELGGFQFL